MFARRLYREWFLFLDDLSVATGRTASAPVGPSNAEDVVGAVGPGNVPPRNRRAASTMGLRVGVLASCAMSSEGAALVTGAAPVGWLNSLAGIAVLLLFIVVFMQLGASLRRKTMLLMILGATQIPGAAAVEANAMTAVITGITALVMPTGLYVITSVGQAGKEAVDRSAEATVERI